MVESHSEQALENDWFATASDVLNYISFAVKTAEKNKNVGEILDKGAIAALGWILVQSN